MSSLNARLACSSLQGLVFELADQDLTVFLENDVLFRRRLVAGRQFAAFLLRKDFENALHERLRLGGFDDERVGAEVQGQAFVFRVGIGGGIDDKGNQFEPFVRLPLFQERIAIHARHQEIGDDQGRRSRAAPWPVPLAVAGLVHDVAMALEQGRSM